MTQTNTVRKYQPAKSRFATKAKANTISWNFLNQKIVALAKNQASPKELSSVIAGHNEFAEYVVRFAGLKNSYQIDNDTIIRALLLIGTDRLCELAMKMA